MQEMFEVPECYFDIEDMLKGEVLRYEIDQHEGRTP